MHQRTTVGPFTKCSPRPWLTCARWSRDGSLLASGSDDTRVNIYNTNTGFSLNTQIETGHTQNIFSVKFMPHSSDRTIITAAGDTQVRIFDIEYAPPTFSSASGDQPQPTATPNPRRRRGRTQIQPTPGKVHDRPLRVYTSHSDRVKRIVTESSPHLFLTCSEDGSVRQFDLRQPSEFYTRPGASVNPTRAAPFAILTNADEEDERNPPLISYRRHGIDLNTISCSTSQPHYIALGGSHLYCFLHDRRMLGRDRMQETGQTYSRVPLREPDEESLAGATKCVRRFAPVMGKNWDRRTQNSHVTACKISDANPNELVCSWSGDGVYLFDINQSPHPNEEGLGRERWDPEENKRERRAKREHVARARARKRRRSRSPSAGSSSELVPGQGMRKICSLVVELRNELFGFASSNLLADTDLATERRKSYDAALTLAHTALKRIHRSIEYLDQKDIEILELLGMSRSHSALQTERAKRSTLAKNRRRTRAFVIAAGCVARALGGFVEGIGLGVGAFGAISNGLNEATSFRYRFLNALIAFLNSSLEGVKEQAELYHQDEAELKDDSDAEGAAASEPTDEEKLEKYLAGLERGARSTPVRDVDTSEELFDSEVTMLRAFRRAIVVTSEAAKRYWGERVARAVLMKEGEGIDFAFVDKAFEGEDASEVSSGTQSPMEAGALASALFGDNDGPEGDDEDTEMPNLEDSRSSDDEEQEEDESEEDGESDEEDEDGDEENDDAFWYRRRRNRRGPVEGHAPVWEHTKVYRGHCMLLFAENQGRY